MQSNIKSVHLQNYPKLTEISDEKNLVQDMDMIRDICSTALSIRDKKNLRVRLPLNKITIIGKNTKNLEKYKDIITDEVNVKSIEFVESFEGLAEYKLDLNFKVLGAKLGQKMPLITKAAKSGDWKKLDNGNIQIGKIELNKNECQIKLLPKNTENTAVSSHHDALVELDLNITEELELEGLSRDLVRLIQNCRKQADLNISDRINLFIQTNNTKLQKAIEHYSDYIKEQTLGLDIQINSNTKSEFSFEEKLEDSKIQIGFNK